MVDEYGFPEDADTESQFSGDDLGSMEDLANPQCLDRDLFLSTDSNTSHSSDDEGDEDQDDAPGDQDEDPSPPQVPDHQGAPEVGPSGTPGLTAKVSKK